MHLSKTIFWTLLAVAMIALGALGLSGSYFTSEFHKEASRAQDDSSLSGYWYHRQDAGCFEDGPVYVFENNDATILTSGETTESEIKFSTKGSEWYFYLLGGAGKEYRYFYENTGSTLEIYRSEILDGDEKIAIEQSSTAYTRCEYPTAGGIFMSLFFRVFEPS